MRKRLRAGKTIVRSVAKGFRSGVARMELTERRRFGRFKAQRLGCDKGVVLDLSGGGMRLRSNRRMNGRIAVKVWTPREGVTVHGHVVWTRRLGFRKYEIGVEFCDLTPTMKQGLNNCAVYLASHLGTS